MKRDELAAVKRQRIMQRAHQIAKCVKKYQLPRTRYSLLLRDGMRQAYTEWSHSVMRESIRLRLQNEFGYSEDRARDEVRTMSDWQVNLHYNAI
jgi:hypothetical protein